MHRFWLSQGQVLIGLEFVFANEELFLKISRMLLRECVGHLISVSVLVRRYRSLEVGVLRRDDWDHSHCILRMYLLRHIFLWLVYIGWDG